MKKIFFAATIIAATLTSCSKDQVFAPENDANEMSFGIYTGSSNSTRANDVIANDLITNGFYVQARNNTDASSRYAEQQFTWDTDHYTSAGDKWYWPVSGSLDFFAYNDNLQGAATPNFTFAGVAAGEKPTFDYTTTKLGSTQQDIIVAYVTAQTKPAGNHVPLKFKHALSKVSVNVKANTSATDVKLTVSSIAFKGITLDGKCKVEETETAIPTWIPGSTIDDIALELASSPFEIMGTASPANTPTHSADNALMIIPNQTFGNIEIAYTWTQGTNVIETVTNKLVDLSSIGALAANSHYTINLKITPDLNEITFTARVDGFTAETGVDFAW